MSEQNFEVQEGQVQFAKRTIREITKDSKTIDPIKVGNEVMAWLLVNVENFIDSSSQMFKLDLILDNVAGMSETTKLQNLYRAIPDSDEMTTKELDKATKCRKMLDGITNKAYEHIQNSKDVKAALFNRMIFYYEKIIITPENKRKALEIDAALKALILRKDEVKADAEKKAIQALITEKIKEGEALVKFEQFEGVVDIPKFEYEAFSVGVEVRANKEEMLREDGEINEDQEKEVVNKYMIPEGFTLWLELTYKPKLRPSSMF